MGGAEAETPGPAKAAAIRRVVERIANSRDLPRRDGKRIAIL
jgi:hypothetical protein